MLSLKSQWYTNEMCTVSYIPLDIHPWTVLTCKVIHPALIMKTEEQLWMTSYNQKETNWNKSYPSTTMLIDFWHTLLILLRNIIMWWLIKWFRLHIPKWIGFGCKNTILLTFLLNKLMKQTGFASSSISNDQKLKQEIWKQEVSILASLNIKTHYNCYFLLS